MAASHSEKFAAALATPPATAIRRLQLLPLSKHFYCVACVSRFARAVLPIRSCRTCPPGHGRRVPRCCRWESRASATAAVNASKRLVPCVRYERESASPLGNHQRGRIAARVGGWVARPSRGVLSHYFIVFDSSWCREYKSIVTTSLAHIGGWFQTCRCRLRSSSCPFSLSNHPRLRPQFHGPSRSRTTGRTLGADHLHGTSHMLRTLSAALYFSLTVGVRWVSRGRNARRVQKHAHQLGASQPSSAGEPRRGPCQARHSW